MFDKTVSNSHLHLSWHPEKPYNALPLLPMPLEAIETTRVLKACIKARAALGELKQAAELIPNQAMLIKLLPLLEAKASSEIENIVTTTDKLFQHMNDVGFANAKSGADPATKEALRYSSALMEGYLSLKFRPITTRTTEEICSIIKGVDMQVRKVGSTTLINDATGQVIYTPPTGENALRDFLKNWEDFLHNQTQIDPLIRLAIGHYQFEAIHPFSDGNGRTGRVINSLFLIQEGLLTLPILYLSRYFIAHKSTYYQLLNAITQNGQWEDWLLFVITGIEETAHWTLNKIVAMRALVEHTSEYIKANQPKIYSHELVNLIFELPYCRISSLTEQSLVKRQTAGVYLKKLCDIKVLTEIQIGKEKLFLHPKIIELLKREDNTFELYRTSNHAPN